MIFFSILTATEEEVADVETIVVIAEEDVETVGTVETVTADVETVEIAEIVETVTVARALPRPTAEEAPVGLPLPLRTEDVREWTPTAVAMITPAAAMEAATDATKTAETIAETTAETTDAMIAETTDVETIAETTDAETIAEMTDAEMIEETTSATPESRDGMSATSAKWSVSRFLLHSSTFLHSILFVCTLLNHSPSPRACYNEAFSLPKCVQLALSLSLIHA